MSIFCAIPYNLILYRVLELMDSKFTDEDFFELLEKVKQKKLDELFEEPSSYEDELDDD